jgi:hypothetical protein
MRCAIKSRSWFSASGVGGAVVVLLLLLLLIGDDAAEDAGGSTNQPSSPGCVNVEFAVMRQGYQGRQTYFLGGAGCVRTDYNTIMFSAAPHLLLLMLVCRLHTQYNAAPDNITTVTAAAIAAACC